MKLSLFHHWRERSGMTLIEVLLSIAVLAALFITIASKFDIGDIFWKLGKTGHQSAVRALGSAIKRYEEDHAGRLPGPSEGVGTMITATEKPICKQTVSAADCTAAGGVSISAITEGGKYLVEIPVDGDFSGPLTLMTGYLIQLVQEGRVRITAATNSGVIFTY